MPDGATKPPGSSEVGAVNTSASFLSLGWQQLIDEVEHVPELRFPLSIPLFEAMSTDSQISALTNAIEWPLRSRLYKLDPNGAPDEAVRKISEDLGGLGIVGEEDKPRAPISRRASRFSFDNLLRLALKAPLTYGFYPFEQVAEYDSEGFARIKKLAPRPPRTIENIKVAKDGGISSVVQRGETSMSNMGSGLGGVEIPVERIVLFSWDTEPGIWTGRPVLRDMWRDYLIKDMLIRINAMAVERNGFGIPIIEAPAGASDPVVNALSALAQSYKMGEAAGGAIPNGSRLRLVGVEGSLPDIVESMRYHDEQMAKVCLEMFVQLGQTQTGSRALGESFIDFFALGLDAIANWFCDTVNQHIIDDWMDWNYPSDTQSPRLVNMVQGSIAQQIEPLLKSIEVGAITVGPEVETALRTALHVPARPEATDSDSDSGQQIFAYDLENGVVTIDEARAAKNPPLPPRADGLGALTVPEFLAQFGGTVQSAVEGDLATAASTRDNPLRRVWNRVTRRSVAAQVDDNRFRRGLTAVETQAATDFEALDDEWQDTVEALVGTLSGSLRDEQIAALVDQIEAADGDLDALAAIAAPVVGEDDLRNAMRDTAASAAKGAASELGRQGFADAASTLSDETLEAIDKRAEVTAALIASSLTEAAARNAVTRTGGALSAAEVAGEVGDYLSGFSTRFLQDIVGGVVQGAQNEGRFEVLDDAPDGTTYYASEILDANTCTACSAVDQTEYASLADATADYPFGGYKDCEGGDRCRGTVVAILPGEAEATL